MMDADVRRKIEREIDLFDGTTVGLRHLIDNFDVVWNTESWREANQRAFRQEWGKLEEVYATAIERQPPRLTEMDEVRARAALGELRKLLPDES